MVAYTDELTTGGKIQDLSHRWKTLRELEPKFGYCPEAGKSWLIIATKELHENERRSKTHKSR